MRVWQLGLGALPGQPTIGRRRRAAAAAAGGGAAPPGRRGPITLGSGLTVKASSTCCVSTTSLARSISEAAIGCSSVSEAASAVSTLSCSVGAGQLSAMRQARRPLPREPARPGAHLRCLQPLRQLHPAHSHRPAAAGRQGPPRTEPRRGRRRPSTLHGTLHSYGAAARRNRVPGRWGCSPVARSAAGRPGGTAPLPPPPRWQRRLMREELLPGRGAACVTFDQRSIMHRGRKYVQRRAQCSFSQTWPCRATTCQRAHAPFRAQSIGVYAASTPPSGTPRCGKGQAGKA